MLNTKRFAIFSLKGIDTGFNAGYIRSKIEHDLKSKSLGFKIVKGSYKGTLETSILVIVDTDAKWNFIQDLAFRDGQESILLVNENRKANLVYRDYSVEPIGDFRNVSAVQAAELENWTLDTEENLYYACI